MLEVKALRAGYRGRQVLRGATLHVRPGELCALLGENGSGKSTLLRALCALVPAQYEVCSLEGRDLPGMSARQRALCAAYIPQRCAIDGGLTAEEVVLMGANARTPLLSGYAPAQREEARGCLARVGAQALVGRLMGTLSEGQRQLVVLARALMQRPRLFLLDEPDSALDLSRRYAMMDALRAAMGADCGALAVLHDAQLALPRQIGGAERAHALAHAIQPDVEAANLPRAAAALDQGAQFVQRAQIGNAAREAHIAHDGQRDEGFVDQREFVRAALRPLAAIGYGAPGAGLQLRKQSGVVFVQFEQTVDHVAQARGGRGQQRVNRAAGGQPALRAALRVQ